MSGKAVSLDNAALPLLARRSGFSRPNGAHPRRGQRDVDIAFYAARLDHISAMLEIERPTVGGLAPKGFATVSGKLRHVAMKAPCSIARLDKAGDMRVESSRAKSG